MKWMLIPLLFAAVPAERSEFLKKAESQIASWDRQIASLKVEKGETLPDDKLKILDDAELQIKDLRGDVLKLRTTSPDGDDRLKKQIDYKMAGVKDTLRDLPNPEKRP